MQTLRWIIEAQFAFIVALIGIGISMIRMTSQKSINTEQRVNNLINLVGTAAGTGSGASGAIGDVGTTTQGAPSAPGTQGAPSTPGNIGTAGTIYSQSYNQALADRVNDLQGNINGDLNSAVARINDLIGNINGDLAAVINRMNDVVPYLSSGGGGLYDNVTNALRPRINQAQTALQGFNAL